MGSGFVQVGLLSTRPLLIFCPGQPYSINAELPNYTSLRAHSMESSGPMLALCVLSQSVLSANPRLRLLCPYQYADPPPTLTERHDKTRPNDRLNSPYYLNEILSVNSVERVKSNHRRACTLTKPEDARVIS
jgi:hypothetical protein